ncbi:TlpA family protein disulfide reductase [Alishewanella tabrizica]|uniref:Thiol:disulfide interchange protein n=1 Tax=Alishewanella tabrizica TaxID=671278 RepID=A0ABQ2WGZ1_9ALTE|nr:TlpA disulfide reductase family protein [Alishewanella tabrizica]GGW51639.1 thiol:disulfide interchange protein [Alishewanella tabrizica]
MLYKSMVIVFVMVLSFRLAAVPQQGDVPPPFLGYDITGEKVTLDAYKGKVVVVSFWASWCAPCLQELPVLNAVQNEAGSELMHVIAVNYKEDKRRYRKVQKVISESLPALIFTHDEKGLIGGKYGVEGLPNLFVIGKHGKVVYHSVGFGEASLDSLVTVLNNALDEQITAE